MPAGIWTIDSRLSPPFKARLSIGTPSTGSGVNAATMPGRCAAPPAPAMIRRSPRDFAVRAYSKRRSGVRCAETIRVSQPIPNRSRVLTACCIVSQSDWLPMMIPTLRLASSIQLPLEASSTATIIGAEHGGTSGHGHNPPSAPRRTFGLFCPSGDDVGQQLALDLGDLVFEQQLSLLQPLQFELVDRSARGKTRDRLVEIAMFGFQRGELCFQSFDVEIHGHARRVRRNNNTTDAPCTIRPERCRNTAVSCSSSKRIGTLFAHRKRPTDPIWHWSDECGLLAGFPAY